MLALGCSNDHNMLGNVAFTVIPRGVWVWYLPKTRVKLQYCHVRPPLWRSMNTDQARRQGGCARTHPPPQERKRYALWVVKNLKWYKHNVVMVAFKISMHFQQFEDLKFLFLPVEHAPRLGIQPLFGDEPTFLIRGKNTARTHRRTSAGYRA